MKESINSSNYNIRAVYNYLNWYYRISIFVTVFIFRANVEYFLIRYFFSLYTEIA